MKLRTCAHKLWIKKFGEWSRDWPPFWKIYYVCTDMKTFLCKKRTKPSWTTNRSTPSVCSGPWIHLHIVRRGQKHIIGYSHACLLNDLYPWPRILGRVLFHSTLFSQNAISLRFTICTRHIRAWSVPKLNMHFIKFPWSTKDTRENIWFCDVRVIVTRLVIIILST